MGMPNMGSFSNLGINPSDILKNIEGKIHYPATKDQIVHVINDIPDIPDPAKQLVENKLPDGEYKNVDDIKKVIHI